MGAGRVRARARRNNGGGGGPNWLRPEEKSLNIYVLWQAYVLMAVTGLGYLALTWSTVVLLGGFVTTLGRKDFWCLTAISMIHAARTAAYLTIPITITRDSDGDGVRNCRSIYTDGDGVSTSMAPCADPGPGLAGTLQDCPRKKVLRANTSALTGCRHRLVDVPASNIPSNIAFLCHFLQSSET